MNCLIIVCIGFVWIRQIGICQLKVIVFPIVYFIIVEEFDINYQIGLDFV